jgi:signal transduction histidine kinase
MHPGIRRALSARRSLSLFLAVVVCLAMWQVWLTWRLMEQDRNLEVQHSRQRLEQTAHLVLSQLERRIGDWDLAVRELRSLPPSTAVLSKVPSGATFILISRSSIALYPKRPLLFVPEVPVQGQPQAHAFDAADELELQEREYDRAIAVLQPLLNGSATRAEALVRIARIERKANRPQAALDTYKRLESEKGLNVSGTPYAVLAADARCQIFIQLGKRENAMDEARSLRDALLEGYWPIRHETFNYYWAELANFGIDAAQPPESSLRTSVLVSELYNRWQSAARADSTTSGRDPTRDSSLLVWNATPDRLAAMITTPEWLGLSLGLPADIHWKMVLPGAPAQNASSVTRSLADAKLPGLIEFFTVTQVSGVAHSRRFLWLAGVGLMLLLVLVSAYAVHRGISQELRVAQLQSDFVSAVSHEFRSPLTTLRTITELLAQNRIADEARRQQSYQFLDHETNRLHRLVEDLLDFGRMESGRKQYHLETHDAFQLVRASVADFTEEAEARGFRIETNLGSTVATVQADEEALRRAIRNLLENAVKYSPECKTVWVEGAVTDHQVSISVRDQGMGIDAREQREIFQKFVRGAAAKKAGIKGTGIGLSMVDQISRALGGEIYLQSKLGAGSTFTIVLPLAGE